MRRQVKNIAYLCPNDCICPRQGDTARRNSIKDYSSAPLGEVPQGTGAFLPTPWQALSGGFFYHLQVILFLRVLPPTQSKLRDTSTKRKRTLRCDLEIREQGNPQGLPTRSRGAKSQPKTQISRMNSGGTRVEGGRWQAVQRDAQVLSDRMVSENTHSRALLLPCLQLK